MVTPVNSTGTTATQMTQAQSVGKDQFLRLFLTQLQNQNPLEPMQDRDFLMQLAQFTQVENTEEVARALQNLQTLAHTTQATNLLGKRVVALREGDSAPVEGVVSAVRFSSDGAWLKVGNDDVRVDNVLQVSP
ncbi:MAG: flagellar hook capping protein [Chthonomonadetes bacterium]|nr:flagellar hook capping protein [Chthonomonadetes bacterium]